MQTTASSHSHARPPEPDDDEYPLFLAAIRDRFAALAGAGEPFFLTERPAMSPSLWEVFLSRLPQGKRQHYTCHACKRFVDNYGGLVTILEDGALRPVFWDEGMAPEFFRSAVIALAASVRQSKVCDVFFHPASPIGTPSNRATYPALPGGGSVMHEWHHMAIPLTEALKARGVGPSTDVTKATAEKREDRKTLYTALMEFTVDHARSAHHLFDAKLLPDSERHAPMAKWFRDLYAMRENARSRQAADNLLWREVAMVPTGFTHIRNTVVGTVLQQVKGGMTYDAIRRSFGAKVDPLQYQRPQAAPTAGNIAVAEKLVAQLQSAGSLARRFARLEDVVAHALWTPKPAAVPAVKGVFGHLLGSKPALPGLTTPAVTMTWEKFRTTVLPKAQTIEYQVPATTQSYTAMVTAVDPSAPPLLQWDREDLRNPVAWYFYDKGSYPQRWNLTPGTWVPVTAIVPAPNMWDATRDYSHQGRHMFFLLKDARDVDYERSGLFFPVCLRSEYREIRSAMEAFAQSGVIAGKDQATACGIALNGENPQWNREFRVTTADGVQVYKIDRWD